MKILERKFPELQYYNLIVIKTIKLLKSEHNQDKYIGSQLVRNAQAKLPNSFSINYSL